MLGTAEQKFLVIDALDECLKGERQSLLPFIRTFAKNIPSCGGALRIFATSRPEHDIEHSLYHPYAGTERLVTCRLLLGERREHRESLEAFIKAELEGPRFYGLGWSLAFRQRVTNELLAKSESMFLWAQLQLQRLAQCSETEAHFMLCELPTNLPTTYARILNEIDLGRQRTVRAVLECIIAANDLKRPLSLTQVADIFRFDLYPAAIGTACLSLGASILESGPSANPIYRALSPRADVDPLHTLKLLPSGLLKLGENNLIR
ncbi:hypothetical protein DL93DRAFT_2223769, partial [Clavulina sp. PMI_390]